MQPPKNSWIIYEFSGLMPDVGTDDVAAWSSLCRVKGAECPTVDKLLSMIGRLVF